MKKAKKRTIDRTKTIQDLEQKDWGAPTYNSYLVTTIHELRRKPLNDYSIEDLRIMIGQNVGLEFLVPLAIERLQETPLAAGDYYAGDLLKAVLCVDESFWKKNQDMYKIIETIVDKAKSMMRESDQSEYKVARKAIEEGLQKFTK